MIMEKTKETYEKKNHSIKDNVYVRKEIPAIRRFFERESVKALLSAIAGFFLMRAKFGGIRSPFAVSLCVGLGVIENAAVLFGMIISTVISGEIYAQMAEMLSVLFILALKVISSHRFSVKGGVILSGAVYLSFGLLMVFYMGYDTLSFIGCIFKTIVCVCGTYFFERALSVSFGDTSPDIIPLYICAAVILSSFCAVDIYVFNIGRIIIFFLTLIFAKKYGAQGGAAAAGIGCASMIMANPDFRSAASFSVICSLAAGLSYHKDKMRVTLTYIVSALLVTVIIGLPSETIEFIADTLTAAIIYFIVPERIYSPAMDNIDRRGMSETRHLSMKLNFSSEIFDEIGNDILAARRIYDSKVLCHDGVYSIKENICSGCKAEKNCAVKNKLESIYDDKKEDANSNLSKCIKKTEIVKNIEREHLLTKLKNYNERVSMSICLSSVEQLKADSLTLREFIDTGLKYNSEVSLIVSEALREFDLNVKSSAVYFDGTGRAYVEIFMIDKENIPFDKITDKLSSLTGSQLDEPLVEKTSGGKNLIRCRFKRIPEIIAEVSIKGMPGGTEKSGDTSGYFYDGFGTLYVIIADGMGSGQRAAEESCMAYSLIKRLLRSGVGVKAAVSYTNILLGSVSRDEMFTTVDILKFDTFTGVCTFYKQGAAASYIKTGEEVKEVQNVSFPVGILTESSVIPIKYNLCAGDVIIMTSDGIEADEKYISEVMMNSSATSEIYAEKVLSYQKENNANSKSDDKTVCAVKLYKY